MDLVYWIKKVRVTIPVYLAAALTKEKLKQLNQYTLFPIDVFPTKGLIRNKQEVS
nr:MAG TPA: hypothetical protein [Caudoviricetes sp.]